MVQHQTLILTQKDIKNIVHMPQAIDAVEHIFSEYGHGRVSMPAKLYLDLPQYQGDFRAMPAYVKSIQSVSLKWVNSHSLNSRHNLPAVMGMLILSDPKTGYPLAIMDATYLTDLRTGAAGAVAAKYLANPDSNKVALVGCGSQARTQLLGLKEMFEIEEVSVWGHKPGLAKKFVNMMLSIGLPMRTSSSIKECISDADIIVTTTPSHKPLVKKSWISSSAHINAIGADAPGKRELDLMVLKQARIVVDDWQQASHSGEINVAVRKKQITRRDVYGNLGDIVAGKKKGRTLKNQVTIFDSTGLAIQDTALARLIYDQAKLNKVGTYKTML